MHVFVCECATVIFLYCTRINPSRRFAAVTKETTSSFPPHPAPLPCPPPGGLPPTRCSCSCSCPLTSCSRTQRQNLARLNKKAAGNQGENLLQRVRGGQPRVALLFSVETNATKWSSAITSREMQRCDLRPCGQLGQNKKNDRSIHKNRIQMSN